MRRRARHGCTRGCFENKPGDGNRWICAAGAASRHIGDTRKCPPRRRGITPHGQALRFHALGYPPGNERPLRDGLPALSFSGGEPAAATIIQESQGIRLSHRLSPRRQFGMDRARATDRSRAECSCFQPRSCLHRRRIRSAEMRWGSSTSPPLIVERDRPFFSAASSSAITLSAQRASSSVTSNTVFMISS